MDTNAGCEANTNTDDKEDQGDCDKDSKDGDRVNLKILQHRSWTRLAATVTKGRGPRKIEVR